MQENNKKDRPTRLADARDLARKGNCRIVEKNGIYKIWRVAPDSNKPSLVSTCHSIGAVEIAIAKVTSNLKFDMLANRGEVPA